MKRKRQFQIKKKKNFKYQIKLFNQKRIKLNIAA